MPWSARSDEPTVSNWMHERRTAERLGSRAIFRLTRFRGRTSRTPAASTNSICASRAGPTMLADRRSSPKIIVRAETSRP